MIISFLLKYIHCDSPEAKFEQVFQMFKSLLENEMSIEEYIGVTAKTLYCLVETEYKKVAQHGTNECLFSSLSRYNV